jgi:L-lactate dehydrogenase complex protein LldF
MTRTFLGMPTAPPGVGHLRGERPFPEAARAALADTQLRRNLGKATTTIRAKRAAVVGELPDWAELRAAGAAIKDEVLAHLDRYLVQLEEQVVARGGVVHWARDATEANRVVAGIVGATGARSVVKVKSMATQEIGLNEALADAGIAAWETDLAELIVQLGHDAPSHILVPAIHRNRAEIREIFLREMAAVGVPAPPGLSDEPRVLAEAARLHLRRKFLDAEVAISGANFAVAETGTLVVVESEGNGRMCLTLPRVLVTVMGIEKLLPTWRDLEVFLQLLPRSSTGERMNPYTSMWTGVTPGDGPREFHLVLLDNGRTATLADPQGRDALRCIRCSACLNVCPVYERTGGHAYGSVYPGPIGAVLSPQLTGVADNPSLPFASTLCGACLDACPVAIDIPAMLVHLRSRVVEAKREQHRLPTPERLLAASAAWAMARPGRWGRALRAARAGRLLGTGRRRISNLPPPLAAWTHTRDLPVPPRETFREWWTRSHTAGDVGEPGTGPDVPGQRSGGFHGSEAPQEPSDGPPEDGGAR